MPPEGVAFLVTLTIIGSTVLLFPLVRALAERIRSKNVDAGVREELQVLREDLLAEIQQARREIGDLGERVDFTERLLAKPSQHSCSSAARSGSCDRWPRRSPSASRVNTASRAWMPPSVTRS